MLPKTRPDEKTEAIRLWMKSVIVRVEHYKAEHYALLKEYMTQLELAVWKAKLDEREERGIDGYHWQRKQRSMLIQLEKRSVSHQVQVSSSRMSSLFSNWQNERVLL